MKKYSLIQTLSAHQLSSLICEMRSIEQQDRRSMVQKSELLTQLFVDEYIEGHSWLDTFTWVNSLLFAEITNRLIYHKAFLVDGSEYQKFCDFSHHAAKI